VADASFLVVRRRFRFSLIHGLVQPERRDQAGGGVVVLRCCLGLRCSYLFMGTFEGFCMTLA
ncbi:hypothetical protein, partial [Arthrobacter sp. M4]|uniref:hypothetical protein n=1 Tax=Arthrobacter sp. M4 TaxID=218160 RepID=UPI001CDD49FA